MKRSVGAILAFRRRFYAATQAALSTALVAAILGFDSAMAQAADASVGTALGQPQTLQMGTLNTGNAAEDPLIRFSFGSVESFSGSNVCVPLVADSDLNPCAELGGFDLLFKYDATLLTFQGIDLTGSILVAQDWEYLTYRVVSSDPALIRIVAIADMNNSNQHPSGWCLDGLLASLCFRTTNDRNVACQSAELMFYWADCGDNTAPSRDGNHLYIIADPNSGSPHAGGDSQNVSLRRGIISDSCGIELQLATFEGGIHGPEDFPCPHPDPNKPDPEEMLCFVNGRIRILCPGDTDPMDDINLNGLSYEIADAVLFANYFISGPSVFTINLAGQTASSDVNADGIPLTVADLVYLIRVITGDAPPLSGYPLECPPQLTTGRLQVTSVQQGANVTVSANSDADLGAGLFVFNYSSTDIAGVSAMGRAANMNAMWAAEGGQLRVLVMPHMGGSHADRLQSVAAGSGPILRITTHGATVELVSVEAATYMGGAFETLLEARVLPTQFALKQNFPNPFNPSTSMAIDFPTASDYKLTIYNVAGQIVRAFSGHSEAGSVTMTWDGRDAGGGQVATGVYFYSVEADGFRDTKRMLLLR